VILLCAWIALVAPLISAYLCCKSVSRPKRNGFFLLCLTVLWMTFLILPVQLMGALEIARLIPRVTVSGVAFLQLAVLVAAIALYFRYRPQTTFSAEDSSVSNDQRLPSYLKLSAAIVGGSYLVFATNLCTSFPQGSDALAYHIPLALRWLQEGSLRIPVDNAWEFSLPGNGEIIQMLALATGKQFLVPLENWVASIVLMIAAYSIAVRFSKGMKHPGFAAILILFSIPIIEFQTFSAYVDLFGTAFLFAAVTLFGHRYHSSSALESNPGAGLSLTAVTLSALACGLSLGTKTIFLPYCALFFAKTMSILLRERRIHNKSMALLSCIVVIGILLPSAFWYARELQATGNPLYPTPIALGRHVIFPGYQSVMPNAGRLLIDHRPAGPGYGDKKFVRRQSEWWIYPWTEWLNVAGGFPIVYGEGSGFGSAFATFVVVGVGFAVFRCFGVFRVQHEASGLTRMAVLLWFVLLLIWIFAMHRELRFGLPVWVYACLLSTPAIALLGKAYPRTSAILFVCSISTTCAISSLVPLHDLAGRLSSGKWSRSAIYNYPTCIDELPAGTTILNDTQLLEKDFALAGNRLTNKVVNAFEAPQELTPEFLSTRHIDYVVQITSANDTQDSSPVALPKSVAGTEVCRSNQLGQFWRIWRVQK
jgi:hypothetical protein